MGEPFEGRSAVATLHDLRPDHAVCYSLAAVLHDSPGAGRADPGPGLEKIGHA